MSAETNGKDQATSANANTGAEQAAPGETQPNADTSQASAAQPAGDAGVDGQKPEAAKAYVDPSIAAEARIAELEAQVAEMRDRYVRAYAETENIRKRSEREKADASKYAVTNFAKDMVAIADNLGRAVEAAGRLRRRAIPANEGTARWCPFDRAGTQEGSGEPRCARH